MAIDVAQGAVRSITSGDSGTQLGNLICVRGSVISQSSLFVDKFEQVEVLQQRAEAALARNQNNPDALRELAELKRASGALNEAADLIKKAHQLAPTDPLIREMIVEYLLAALKADFAGRREDLTLARGLVAGRDREQELMRIEAHGLEKTGLRLDAWEAYLRVADAAGDENSDLEISPTHSVRSDRWLGARIAALWTAATDEERSTMAAHVENRLRQLGPNPSVKAMSRFIDHFGHLPMVERPRLQFAARRVADKQPEAAELELLKLVGSKSAEVRASAVALLVKLQLDAGRIDAAKAYARLLRDQYGDTVSTEGILAKQVVERLAATSPKLAAKLAASWPRGRATSQVESAPGPVISPASRSSTDRPMAFRQLRVEQDPFARLRTEQWFVTTDGRQVAVRKTDGGIADTFEWSGDGNRRIDPSLAHAAKLGSLTFVAFGNRIAAFDSRQFSEGGQPLWEAQPLGGGRAGDRVSTGGRVPPGMVFDARSTRRRDSGRQLAAALGPAAPSGVVFLDENELRCVDPLNGNTLWSRSDVPRTAELFGDDELLFAATVGGNGSVSEAMVLRRMDGELIDRRALPPAPWLTIVGRNVARAHAREPRSNQRLPISVTDVLTGEELLNAQYSGDARLSVVEPNMVAVFEPSGKFQLIDAGTGKLVIDQKLEAHAAAQSIHCSISGDTLILAISATVAPGRHQPIGFAGDFPLVHGPVYAFDLRTGQPCWPSPAYVEERGLVMGAPDDLPIVVFADREARRDTAGAGNMKLRLLCLDKATGQSIYRNDDLLDVADGNFRIQALASGEAAANREREILIETTAQRVRLALTDEPRPPEPPARDELVAKREIEETGIRGALLRATENLQQQQQQIQQQQQNLQNRRGRGRRGGQ
jgi:hypothetical protein